VARADRVANARQKIGYWIGKVHSFSFIPARPDALIACENQRERYSISLTRIAALVKLPPDFSIPVG
jgi:hypothetical protein